MCVYAFIQSTIERQRACAGIKTNGPGLKCDQDFATAAKKIGSAQCQACTATMTATTRKQIVEKCFDMNQFIAIAVKKDHQKQCPKTTAVCDDTCFYSVGTWVWASESGGSRDPTGMAPGPAKDYVICFLSTQQKGQTPLDVLGQGGAIAGGPAPKKPAPKPFRQQSYPPTTYQDPSVGSPCAPSL